MLNRNRFISLHRLILTLGCSRWVGRTHYPATGHGGFKTCIYCILQHIAQAFIFVFCVCLGNRSYETLCDNVFGPKGNVKICFRKRNILNLKVCPIKTFTIFCIFLLYKLYVFKYIWKDLFITSACLKKFSQLIHMYLTIIVFIIFTSLVILLNNKIIYKKS